MRNVFEPLFSEEQLAAYIDGMLSSEENSAMENMMSDDLEMQEIQDAIDAVDSTYILTEDKTVIPAELMSDDFILPEMDFDTSEGISEYNVNASGSELSDDDDETSWYDTDDDQIELYADAGNESETEDSLYNDLLLGNMPI